MEMESLVYRAKPHIQRGRYISKIGWVLSCEKFHQVDTKTVLITLIQPKITYRLSDTWIDWANAKVIDRESDKAGRLIREAIWTRKTDNMNRDEGSYQLSHVWDKLLHTDDRHRKSVLMKASDMKPKRR